MRRSLKIVIVKQDEYLDADIYEKGEKVEHNEVGEVEVICVCKTSKDVPENYDALVGLDAICEPFEGVSQTFAWFFVQGFEQGIQYAKKEKLAK